MTRKCPSRFRQKHIPLFILLFTIFIISYAFNTDFAFAGNSFDQLRYHSQGATITKDYFLFTDFVGDDEETYIYKCNRSGTSFSDCKIIIKGHFNHANVLHNNWGKDYFWIFDKGNPKNGGKKWCYSLDGKAAKDSKCGTIPNNDKYNSKVGVKKDGSDNVDANRQGFTYYNGYFVKGGTRPNAIYVRSQTEKKTYETLTNVSSKGELEDVSVDGDTGEIYYTTVDDGVLYLHKYSGYKLPVSGKADKSSNTDDSNNSTAKSDDSSGSKGGSGVKSRIKKRTGARKKSTSKSTYEGEVNTIFFGKIADKGDGCEVFDIMVFIIDLLTFGIGIAAVLGITLAGATYLTAKGSEEMAYKAKRRLTELIVGLVAYACLWSLLQFLLPGGKFTVNDSCPTASETNNATEESNEG